MILRVLAKLPQYSANSAVLYTALSQFAHYPSRDMVKSELHWLAEQGLLTVAEMGLVLLATLSERVLDVALGRHLCQALSSQERDMARKSSISNTNA